MQVIGLCRFSYPALGGFQVEHETLEAQRHYLYNPKRLNERFHLFETLTLPALRAQTDPEFDFVIVIGDCLPKDSLDRLQQLITDLPQARIMAHAPLEHRKLMQQILNEVRNAPDQPCLQFRLDDDDAIAVDFVTRLRRAAQDCSTAFQGTQTAAIDFNNGYMLETRKTDFGAAQVYRPLISAGLGMYVSGGCDLTVMNFAHQRMARFMPVISYPDAPMWVRSLNGFNDSPKARKGNFKLAPFDQALRDVFTERFAVELDKVCPD
ncbi:MULTISPECIES: putative rhamnosyl transferase [unclassified Ruegeria]|uniref:putative rhamnosyl transferase n=1 Tax=unclassified Ruegeria TaxID=2625375 RepID=UPI0014889A3A|nr:MULTISPECIES: putative rhamnosyl transferase [unclassified Ruegeria]